MNINRAVVKQQAKDIIKGNILKLFFISIIIGFLAGGSMSYNYNSSDLSKVKDYFNKDNKSYSYEYGDRDDDFGFGGYSNQYDENFFDNFDGNGMVTLTGAIGLFAGAMTLVGMLAVAKGLFLGPLTIMLDGLYWQLIKGNNMEFGDGLGFVFKKTFDKDYWSKFLLNLIRSLLLGLLYMLLIVPGVIFNYKWYFASYIMAEKPGLKFDEAMKLSDKMTKGHKGELFVMDLSFIGWYLLMIPTLGLASIYVTPYVCTTKALYYENFKIRAFQEGAITQYDFMSAQEKMPFQQPAQVNDFYNYGHSVPEEAYRQQPVAPAPVQNYYQPQPPVQQNTYYPPAAPVTPVQQAPTPQAPVQSAPTPEVLEPQDTVVLVDESVKDETIEAPPIPDVSDESEYYTPTEPPQSDNF